MPITSPPAARAPRDAASITPPIPPQTSTAPASPMARPTASASAASSSSGAPFPITAICGGRIMSTLGAVRTTVDALVSPLDAGAVAQPPQLGLEALLRLPLRAVGEPSAVAEVPQLEGIVAQGVALDLRRPRPGALVGLQVGDAVVLGVERRRGPDRR